MWLFKASVDPENVGAKGYRRTQEDEWRIHASEAPYFFTYPKSERVFLSVVSYSGCWPGNRLDVVLIAYACANVKNASAERCRMDIGNVKENPRSSSKTLLLLFSALLRYK